MEKFINDDENIVLNLKDAYEVSDRTKRVKILMTDQNVYLVVMGLFDNVKNVYRYPINEVIKADVLHIDDDYFFEMHGIFGKLKFKFPKQTSEASRMWSYALNDYLSEKRDGRYYNADYYEYIFLDKEKNEFKDFYDVDDDLIKFSNGIKDIFGLKKKMTSQEMTIRQTQINEAERMRIAEIRNQRIKTRDRIYDNSDLDVIFCPYCGAKIPNKNAAFCIKCGKRL